MLLRVQAIKEAPLWFPSITCGQCVYGKYLGVVNEDTAVQAMGGTHLMHALSSPVVNYADRDDRSRWTASAQEMRRCAEETLTRQKNRAPSACHSLCHPII